MDPDVYPKKYDLDIRTDINTYSMSLRIQSCANIDLYENGRGKLNWCIKTLSVVLITIKNLLIIFSFFHILIVNVFFPFQATNPTQRHKLCWPFWIQKRSAVGSIWSRPFLLSQSGWSMERRLAIRSVQSCYWYLN